MPGKVERPACPWARPRGNGWIEASGDCADASPTRTWSYSASLVILPGSASGRRPFAVLGRRMVAQPPKEDPNQTAYTEDYGA